MEHVPVARLGPFPGGRVTGRSSCGKAGPMRVKIDHKLCEANAICMEEAPEVFRLDDRERLHLIVEQPAPPLREKVEAAVRFCPRQALSLLDE